MKETIEALALVPCTNRSPIMILEGNRARALEVLMKDMLIGKLHYLCDSEWTFNHLKQQQPADPVVLTPPGLNTVEKFNKYGKKIKITIEIEDE